MTLLKHSVISLLKTLQWLSFSLAINTKVLTMTYKVLPDLTPLTLWAHPMFSPPLLLPSLPGLFVVQFTHQALSYLEAWHLLFPLSRTLFPQVYIHGSLLNFLCLCSWWGLLWPFYLNLNPLHPGTPSTPFLLYCSPQLLSPSAYWIFCLFFCLSSLSTY